MNISVEAVVKNSIFSEVYAKKKQGSNALNVAQQIQKECILYQARRVRTFLECGGDPPEARPDEAVCFTTSTRTECRKRGAGDSLLGVWGYPPASTFSQDWGIKGVDRDFFSTL
jgi:hypothetical protein